MALEVGWKFPPTNGGKEDGWKDPGIANFTGAPLSSLARETIQNSLDARKSEAVPVEVVFELVTLNPAEIGAEELRAAVVASIMAANDQQDSGASQALGKAVDILGRKGIPCLRVYDLNTTGLPERNWHALVKMQGLSQKEGQGAGGSYGIGKYAPFAVSALRTVFTGHATTTRTTWNWRNSRAEPSSCRMETPQPERKARDSTESKRTVKH